jgi:muconate cycloisomerase
MTTEDRATRIVRLTATEVVVPANPIALQSEGLDRPLHKLATGARGGWSVQFDTLPKVLLELELADGTVGLGELYRDHRWPVVEEMARALLGTDAAGYALQRLPFAYGREYDGFEIALADALARHRRMPVCDLLGGALRDRVAVNAWSGHRRPGDIGPLAAGYAAQGFTTIKFKCDAEDDVVGWCREIAEAAPSLRVVLDPNERWETPRMALDRCRALAAIGNVALIEDPIPHTASWNAWADLRRASPLAIARHVAVPYPQLGQRLADVSLAAEHRAVDGLVVNGGLWDFARADAVASLAGLPMFHGSEVDLGVAEAAYLHACAAARSCTWPSDVFGRLIRSHDLLAEPLRIEPPFALLPDGPGLGVALDPAAVDAHTVTRKEFR